jgi:glycosyltransferase involved in cell wall biosynthesis
LKILLSALACSPEFGSESLVAYHTIEALNTRFEAEVVTSAGMRPPAGVRAYRVNVRFQDPNDVGSAQLLRFEFLQRRTIQRLLRKKSFDLVHRVTPSGYKDSLLARSSVPLLLGPVLGSDLPPRSFHSIFRPKLPRRYSVRAVAARFEQGVARRILTRFSTLGRMLENAALILVGTEVTRRQLPAHLHSRCRLITYSGVEHDRFTPPASRRAAGVPKLLFVGRLVPYKGVELLLRAAAAAMRRCRFDLTIVGDGLGTFGAYCRRLAHELRVTDAVKFVGRQPRDALVEMYRAADIFCMPSIETYGIAILEAMSSGCVPLVADYNGPGEIVQPGTGLKVPLQTPEQFVEEYAERIVQLVEDATLRSELGERGREHVVRFHDWKRIESSLLEAYSDVFSQGQAATAQLPCRRAIGSA